MEKAYLGYNPRLDIRERSSSGGLFYELASNILSKNGVVYGASFTEDFQVKHIRINDIEQLECLLRSKYVQSDIKEVYIPLEKDLKEGKYVMFAGTPCQIAAISNFARVNKLSCERLYLIDFICHGVPSPKIWESYLSYLSKGEKIKEINFREKSKAGWHDYHFFVKYVNSREKKESHEINAYMRTFLGDKNLRPACYNCKFKRDFYCSDITLGDAWKIEKEKSEWSDDRGTSLFVVRTNKGKGLMEEISTKFISCETNYDKWGMYNPSMINASIKPIGRKEFFDDFGKMSTNDFWEKYKKIPLKSNIKFMMKSIVRVLNLQKIIRKIVN